MHFVESNEVEKLGRRSVEFVGFDLVTFYGRFTPFREARRCIAFPFGKGEKADMELGGIVFLSRR